MIIKIIPSQKNNFVSKSLPYIHNDSQMWLNHLSSITPSVQVLHQQRIRCLRTNAEEGIKLEKHADAIPERMHNLTLL